MTAEQLAKLVILTLKAQRAYFDTRDHDALIKSKALERQLRNAANDILALVPPAPKQDQLF